jgi:hypothetical protein
MSRNQGAKFPDGRRDSVGMSEGAAVPGPATMDPVFLGGAGGAIRTSGWSDSHQWVEHMASRWQPSVAREFVLFAGFRRQTRAVRQDPPR